MQEAKIDFTIGNFATVFKKLRLHALANVGVVIDNIYRKTYEVKHLVETNYDALGFVLQIDAERSSPARDTAIPSGGGWLKSIKN